MKHTPGPWKLHECDNATKEEENVAFEIRRKNQVLADIKIGNSNQEFEEEWVELIEYEESYANAQLIARAPELLEENESLKNELSECRQGRKTAIKVLSDEVDSLKAINKQLLEALGESAEIIKHDLNDWIMPTDRKERCLNYLSLLINNTKL